MLHELRVYRCVPGKLLSLHKRFETIVLPMWQKYGIRAVGFWTVAIGATNQDLYYLLEWRNLAEREEKWNAFSTDAEWLKARAETERDGTLVAHATNYILTPTDYSPLR